MASPFYVAPLGGLQTYQNLGNIAAQGIQKYQAAQQAQQEQQRQQQVMQQAQEVFQRGNPREMAAFSLQNPEVGKRLQDAFGFTNEQTRPIAISTYQRALADPENAVQILDQGIQDVEAAGGRANNMRRDRELLRSNPDAGMQVIEMGFAGVAPDVYEQFYGGGTDLPAGVREFNSMVEAAGLQPGTEEYAQAALVNLGLEPRAGISAQERIANDPALAQRVSELERQTQAAKEQGKLEQQQRLLPGIRASIKEAEQQAQSQGEALSDLNRAEAALPGLKEVVGKLVDLSDVATYTWGGRVFDTAVKELGFGATEGATARAKMESLVNNQILPLLRDTFGAQFTEREGEQLRKTMLDIDAAPAQKREILNSFLEQKMRDLETKRQQAGVDEEEGGGIMSMSLEQLNAMNPAEMSPQELERAAARYEQLGAQ